MFIEEYSLYWKTVIDTMMDGLLVVDTQGTIIFVNQAMEEMCGYSKEELIGKSCVLLECDFCLGVRAKGENMHCQLFKKGKISRKKGILRRKDGTPVHVLKNAAILKDSHGKVIGGVETLTDLSDAIKKEKVISQLRKKLSAQDSFYGLIGHSKAMLKVYDLIESTADSDAPVIIYGESGTGKELVASAIHRLGPRKNGPFLKVNCAALNESLLESELFGHVKGAFTGAEKTRVGRFEAASGGDIFLDEIGDLSLSTQVKLLRVLQEKEIERVGDHRPIPIDVRIITATNKDLPTLIEEGRFREDLYYRIGVIPIHLPPLRERSEDIPLLLENFIERLRLKTGKPITGVSTETFRLLMDYHWPGNVRELINVVEYAFVVCKEDVIMPEHLPPRILMRTTGKSKSLAKESRYIMKENIIEALKATNGNRQRAAKILGISRVTLWKRMKELGIKVDPTISI